MSVRSPLTAFGNVRVGPTAMSARSPLTAYGNARVGPTDMSFIRSMFSPTAFSALSTTGISAARKH